MLDAFIIEELRRREEAERGVYEQPRIERPLEERREPGDPSTGWAPPPPPPSRGPVVIEY